MIAENVTNLNPDRAFNILLSTTRKNINKRYFHSLMVLIAGIAIFIIGFHSQKLYISFGAVFIAIAIVYAVYNFICYVRAKKNVLIQNKEICENGISYNYKFKEQSIQILTTEGTKKNKLEYKYDSVKKVFEYDDYYEIKLKGYEVLYVFKSGFAYKGEDAFKINLNKNKKKIITKINKNNGEKSDV